MISAGLRVKGLMLKTKVAYSEALSLVLDHVPLGQAEAIELSGLNGRILSKDITALVDSPSLDVSLKDGYALLSQDVNSAGPTSPVVLSLAGFQAAGGHSGQALKPGSCVRVTTGAPLPPEADAVLASEFTREEDGRVWCLNIAEHGRNVLPRGTDVRAGDVIARQGERLGPALIGLLAAAGLDRAPVVARPRVAVLGTGDEVVAPGRPLPQGKLYASNIVETMAWLRAFGLTEVTSCIVPDRAEKITSAIQEMLGRADAFVTSGGAWKSERDLMLRVLEGLGWQGLFHRVRLGPGKAAGFGLLEGRPFFILPGGPPSHEAAFLLLALPGLLAMAGRRGPVFPQVSARLAEPVTGRTGWTQCVHVQLFQKNGVRMARPLKSASRLLSMARKDGLILLPEGVAELKAGQEAKVHCLSQNLMSGERL